MKNSKIFKYLPQIIGVLLMFSAVRYGKKPIKYIVLEQEFPERLQYEQAKSYTLW